MISSFQLLRLSKLPQFKSLFSTHIQTSTLSNVNTTKHHSQNPTEKLANLLSICTDLPVLRQLHAHLIRTHYFELYNLPFQWYYITRSYTRLNSPCTAFHVFLSMLRCGVSPDNYTLPIAIKVVSQVYSLRTCQQLHCVAICCGLSGHEFVQSGLINVYVKACDFGDAYKVFDESPGNLGCWNAIIAGLARYGRSRDVLGMFVRMRRSGLEPDGVTMVSVNSACGGLGDLELGLQLHKYVYQVWVARKEDVSMFNSVIDMYAKCGRMDLAYNVFCEMDQRNVSSWTSMIMGYAMHGHAKEAMEVFRDMIEASVMPNHVTFLGVLSAYVHGGMLDEGKRWFNMMKDVYGIEPQVKHYGCMVDLLGRAGLLKEARKMVEGMPMKPNAVIWGCLLGACERYNDVETGEWVAKHFLVLEPWNEGVYVVLSNIYASTNMWDDVERIRGIMKGRNLAKVQGYSSCVAVT